MGSDSSLFGRIMEWFQGLSQPAAAQQTDEAVEPDGDGFFVYVACNNCDYHLRLRVNRSSDLEREDGGFTWRKTIVDGRCFRKMPAVVQFDSGYRVVEKEIEGGRFVRREAWAENR